MDFVAKRHLVVLSSVCLALLLSACSASSSPATPGSAAPSKSASAAGGSGGGGAGGGGGGGGGGGAAFCDVVKSQGAALRGTGVASLLAGGTPAAWTAYFKATSTMNQQLVDAAPAEIKPAVQTLQASTLALQSEMAAAGYDPTKMGAAKLTSALASPARVKASTDLTKYVLAHCSIDLTKP